MNIFFGQGIHLAEKSPCPVCKVMLDGVTPINSEHRPKAGAITTCVYCGSILRFGLGLRLEEVTKDEMRELQKSDPAQFAVLSRVVRAARLLIHERRQQQHRSN